MIQEYDDDKLSNPGIKSKKISEKHLIIKALSKQVINIESSH